VACRGLGSHATALTTSRVQGGLIGAAWVRLLSR
jgi:hypothetical protein